MDPPDEHSRTIASPKALAAGEIEKIGVLECPACTREGEVMIGEPTEKCPCCGGMGSSDLLPVWQMRRSPAGKYEALMRRGEFTPRTAANMRKDW